MMINALNHIDKINHELITFSDDMDGLRKVPDNIPNDQVLKDNLGKPLTNIPDPFKKFKSFGEHNNEMLKQFLNKFNFKFIFKSSTENYKKGIFNKSLIRVAEKYEEVMNIILPTLRDERKKTYCPFLPICPKTGKVLEIPLLEIDKKTGKALPVFLSISNKGISNTFPVFGQIGKKGQYVFFLSSRRVGNMIFITSSYFSATLISDLLKMPFL